MSERLRWQILRRLAFHHWSRKSELLSTQEIADELNLGRDYVNDECEKMEVLGWVKVAKVLSGDHAAWTTPLGLLVLEQLEEPE